MEIISKYRKNRILYEVEKLERRKIMEVIVGGKYRHFKGNEYKVLCIAYDTEVEVEGQPRKMVVYESLYGEHKIWVRPYEMFVSKVDKKKYPEVEQEDRFAYIGKNND